MECSDVEAGFAKLQGEDFEYYMQTYSIILGRNSKKSSVDLDLFSLGGGMNISRQHARIFYDFQRRCFTLEVLGKNGCYVEGVLHLLGSHPVKLDSQDLIQIGAKEFYFLLPVQSILGGPIGPRHHVNDYGISNQYNRGAQNQHLGLPPPRWSRGVGLGKGRVREYYEEEYDEEEGDGDDGSASGKMMRGDEVDGPSGYEFGYDASGSGGKASISVQLGASRYLADKEIDGRSEVDREAHNQQLLQLEKDVGSSVATVLTDP
ncbi:unnamed protein product [Fraxinus pennsylvanica]|uniref:FHA domain-containing protein n=1 Tax=Fraxinus pennsylvanica TaxID=56036 RepID=A0AAD2E0A7_9LAMI|nr:unnamed protein product [Fraxinus pennsylvanica]